MNRPSEHNYLSHVAYCRALEAYCTELEEKVSNQVPAETLKIALRTLQSAMRGNVDQRWFLESIGAVESVLATTRPQGTTGAPSEG